MYTSLKSANLFSIGTVSKSFGVSDNTIRRMEAAGLLIPAVIKESGYRYYDYDNISRIKTILMLRSFGLVYDDMREYFKNPGDFSQCHLDKGRGILKRTKGKHSITEISVSCALLLLLSIPR